MRDFINIVNEGLFGFGKKKTLRALGMDKDGQPHTLDLGMNYAEFEAKVAEFQAQIKDDPVFHQIMQRNAERYDNGADHPDYQFLCGQIETLTRELAKTYGVDYLIARAAVSDVLPDGHSSQGYEDIMGDLMKNVLNRGD
jgi:hypothetical protein